MRTWRAPSYVCEQFVCRWRICCSRICCPDVLRDGSGRSFFVSRRQRRPEFLILRDLKPILVTRPLEWFLETTTYPRYVWNFLTLSLFVPTSPPHFSSRPFTIYATNRHPTYVTFIAWSFTPLCCRRNHRALLVYILSVSKHTAPIGLLRRQCFPYFKQRSTELTDELWHSTLSLDAATTLQRLCEAVVTNRSLSCEFVVSDASSAHASRPPIRFACSWPVWLWHVSSVFCCLLLISYVQEAVFCEPI